MNIKRFNRDGFVGAMLLVALLSVGAGVGFAQGGGSGGSGGGGGGGVKVVPGPTPTPTPVILPTTPPAPDVIMRESFGAGAYLLRPTGGKGTLKSYTGGTYLSGFWIEYPGSKDTVWLAPPETVPTWQVCSATDDPYEMFSPLQVPPLGIGPDLAAIWSKNGCIFSNTFDPVFEFPTALMPFKAPATAYQISIDAWPAPGVRVEDYLGFGLTGSSLLNDNLATSGSVWFKLQAGPERPIVSENYELRANGMTGPVLASGSLYFDPHTRLVLRYDPVTKMVSASVNEIELGVFPLAIPTPKFIGIEGVGIMDNFVVRKLP